LPVPKYAGNALDPPLRSRFQGRFISNPSIDTLLPLLHKHAPHVPDSILKDVMGFSEALHSIDATKFKVSFIELNFEIILEILW
jgi:hypothetical protein